jgi:hypothetical protein
MTDKDQASTAETEAKADRFESVLTDTLIRLSAAATMEGVIKRWPEGVPQQSSEVVSNCLYALLRAGYVVMPEESVIEVTASLTPAQAKAALLRDGVDGGVKRLYANLLAEIIERTAKAGALLVRTPDDGDCTMTLMAIKVPKGLKNLGGL